MRFARPILAPVLIVVAAFGGWTACVGDLPPSDTGDGAAVGDRLGRCFPDGKCKEGLVCRDGEICLTPDEPKPVSDGGADATTPDATSEADSDAEAGASCTPYVSTPGPRCRPSNCGSGEVCCLVGTDPICTVAGGTDCPAAAATWACEVQTQCGNAECCLYADALDGSGLCTNRVQKGKTRCIAPNQCPASGGRKTCTKDSDCTTNVCRSEEIQTALGFTVVMKVCM